MANHLLLVVAFSLAIAVCLMEAKKPDKSHKIPAKWRRGKKGKADEGMASFKNDIDELRAELDDMKQQCGASNVHFFFHGEGHDAGHQDHESHGEDDVHVHVDLHLDGSHGDGDNHDHVHVAQCQMKDGFVKIVQQVPQEKYAKFMFSFDSLNDGVIDVHVHQNGDMSTGCSGLGPHYDPIDPERDVGDLGIINPDSDDIKAVWFNNTKLSLIGPHSIMGRSIMGHAEDGALMCCVIGVGKDDHDHDHEGHGHEGHGHEDHGHEGHSHAHEGHGHAH